MGCRIQLLGQPVATHVPLLGSFFLYTSRACCAVNAPCPGVAGAVITGVPPPPAAPPRPPPSESCGEGSGADPAELLATLNPLTLRWPAPPPCGPAAAPPDAGALDGRCGSGEGASGADTPPPPFSDEAAAAASPPKLAGVAGGFEAMAAASSMGWSLCRSSHDCTSRRCNSSSAHQQDDRAADHFRLMWSPRVDLQLVFVLLRFSILRSRSRVVFRKPTPSRALTKGPRDAPRAPTSPADADDPGQASRERSRRPALLGSLDRSTSARRGRAIWTHHAFKYYRAYSSFTP